MDDDSERVSSGQAAMGKDSDDSSKVSVGGSKPVGLTVTEVSSDLEDSTQPQYRLYRRRFVGQVALVRFHSNSLIRK